MHGETSRAESHTATEEENVTRRSYVHKSSCHMVSELKFPATCAMAYVYMQFRYRLPVISALQDCPDQAASTPVSSPVVCVENAVTALAYLSQETCYPKLVQQSIIFDLD